MKNSSVLLAALGLIACDSSSGRPAGSTTGVTIYDAAPPVGPADMSTASVGTDGPANTGGGADACAQVTATASLTRKPVDIIFVIDNSGSMSEEIAAVKTNISTSFASIISNSGLDYKVVMLSQFDATDDLSVCIKPPLGGNTCTTETAPVNTPHFAQYSQFIDSNDSFDRILETYDKKDGTGKLIGWSQYLRPDSQKVFVEISDDKPDMFFATVYTAADFETKLFAKQPAMFGNAMARNYTWYSIIGIGEKTPATAAWTAAELPRPSSATECSTAVDQAIEYQQLTHLTGGLAFPICQNMSFDVIFNAIAQGVISGSSVACDFDVPPPPPGQQMVDLTTVVVTYTPSAAGAAPQTFKQVPGFLQCAPGSFYIATGGDAGGGRIVLCPDACNTVKADNQASISVLFDCSSTVS